MNSVNVGGFEITALNDVRGSTFPLEDAFPGVPLSDWGAYLEVYPDAFVDAVTMRNRVGAFLVRGGERLTLIDTGLGSGVPGAGFLLEELRAVGVGPEAIQTVFLTHAHNDHIGGALTSAAEPSFKNARYLISSTERQFASERAREILEKLDAHGVLETVPDGVNAHGDLELLPLPGHTSGQFGVLIAGRVLIAADALHHPAQVDRPEWHTPFDADVKQAIQTRSALLERAEREGWWLAASHFPARFGQVVRQGARRVWPAVPE